MSKLKMFERRFEILKLLQGKEMRTGELAEFLMLMKGQLEMM